MIMKKWILFLMAVVAIDAFPADYVYKYLVFTGSDGLQTAVSTDGLTLSISDGALVATSSVGTTTFTLTDLSKMKFSDSADDLVTKIEGMDELTADDMESGTVEVYNLSGVHKGTFNSIREMKSRVGAGVYVIKQNGKNTKMIVR